MTARIMLHGKLAAGRIALVDDADHALVVPYRWRLYEGRDASGRVVSGPYAYAHPIGPGGRTLHIAMHKLITGWSRTDHIDHDGLNNQRYNLRPVTNAQNIQNARPQRGTSSRYKGVTWHRKLRKWQALIQVNGRARYLGVFAEEDDAARVYNAAALEAFGVYAYLNPVAP